MQPVSVREARSRLGELLDAAQRGESVVITRRGKEIARIVPVAAGGRRLPDLSDFRASIRTEGGVLSVTIRERRESERF